MALSKTSRAASLPKAGKMAGGMKPPSGENYERLIPKTKGRLFDQDKNLVHRRSTLDYVPPAER